MKKITRLDDLMAWANEHQAEHKLNMAETPQLESTESLDMESDLVDYLQEHHDMCDVEAYEVCKWLKGRLPKFTSSPDYSKRAEKIIYWLGNNNSLDDWDWLTEQKKKDFAKFLENLEGER